MSSRRLQDMSSRGLQDMSSRGLQDVFSITILCLWRRLQDVLQDVFKTSSSRFRKVLTRGLWGVLARRLQDALEDVKLLPWRPVEDVFKTNKCLLGNLCQKAFKTTIIYIACGPFTKNKERMKKFQERGDSRYICRNELDKACFQHDMVYGDFKDLIRRTGSDKVLRDKAFHIAKDQKYDGYQRGLVSKVYKFFGKKNFC